MTDDARPADSGRWRRWTPPGGALRTLVLADGDKGPVEEALPAVRSWLEGRGADVESRRDLRDLAVEDGWRPEARPDLVVVLGGDGSVLTATRLFADEPAPTIGINFGRVGFLASLEASAWREGLAQVLDGTAVAEARLRLTAWLEQAGGASTERATALNDVVLSRGASPSMLRVALRADGELVSEYLADGVILATPTGSTAYSLAAGGPVLDPEVEAVVVTPVAAHALSHRPLVLAAGAALCAEGLDVDGEARVAVDGLDRWALRDGDRLRVERAGASYPLLRLPDLDPWRRLRDRLGWRGSFTGPGT